MVFQNYALYPHMTVAENMGFALKMRKIPKDEIDRRVKEAAEHPGPDRAAGPQAPAAVRRAAAAGRDGPGHRARAQVFLMDEPLSNLDAKLRVQMRAEMLGSSSASASTTMYVTHDQTEAMTHGRPGGRACATASCSRPPRRRSCTAPANMFVAGVHRLAGDEPVRGDAGTRPGWLHDTADSGTGSALR